MDQQELKCPVCGGRDLHHGAFQECNAGDRCRFFPEGQWQTWSYGVRAFVCLDCGFLGHYLPLSEVALLHAEVSKTRQMQVQ